MSDYTDTLAATSGKNLGKLHEELSTALGKADAAQKRAEGYRKEADDNREKAERLWGENRRLREQLADLQAGYTIAKRNQSDAEHRARALAYALQPIVERANESPIGAFLPVEWQLINEAQAIMGNADAGPRTISRLVAAANENALRRNDDKPDWRGDSPFERLEKLTEEYGEVREAVLIYINEDVDEAQAMTRIAEECEDVIASAGFLLDWARGWNTVNRGREVAHAEAL